MGSVSAKERKLPSQLFFKHAVEKDGSAMVTENIKATKHTVLSDGDNNISANKMAVIPARCIDKEDGEVWMLFVGTPSCNYPMTEPFWAMIDETF